MLRAARKEQRPNFSLGSRDGQPARALFPARRRRILTGGGGALNDGTDAVRSYPIDRVGRGGASPISCAAISTCIRASIASSPPALEDGREDPGEEHSGEDEERNRDQERDPDSEAGKGGHGRGPVKVMRDEDEKARHSSSKAVAATLMLFGIVLFAVLLFVVVLVQRAC